MKVALAVFALLCGCTAIYDPWAKYEGQDAARRQGDSALAALDAKIVKRADYYAGVSTDAPEAIGHAIVSDCGTEMRAVLDAFDSYEAASDLGFGYRHSRKSRGELHSEIITSTWRKAVAAIVKARSASQAD